MYLDKIYKFNIEDKLNKFLLLLFFITPFLFIIGSFFVNLITIICLISFFYLFFRNKVKFQLSVISFFFIIIIIYLIVNPLFSLHFDVSIKKSVGYIRFIFFSYIIIYMCNFIFRERIFHPFEFVSLALVFVCFDTLVQFFFDKDLFGFEVDYNHAYGRLSGPFGSEFIIGIYLLVFGLSHLFFLEKIKKRKKYFYFFIFCSLGSLIFITGERNAFLTFLIFLVILIFLSKNLRVASMLSMIFLIFFSFSMIQNSMVFYNKYNVLKLPQISKKNEKDKTINIETSKFQKSKKTQNRLDKFESRINNSQWLGHYRGAYEIYLKNKIFGSGFKTFRYECHQVSKKNTLCSSHPHNLYFEILSDLGLTGMLIFITFNLIILYNFFKKKKYLITSSSIIFSLYFSFIFPLKPHGSLLSTNTSFMYWYILSILIWSIYNTDE